MLHRACVVRRTLTAVQDTGHSTRQRPLYGTLTSCAKHSVHQSRALSTRTRIPFLRPLPIVATYAGYIT